MSQKLRFPVDSDFTGNRCNIRYDHSGNIALAPPDASFFRRAQRDTTSTDFISPEVQEAALPPACVSFIVGNTNTLGEVHCNGGPAAGVGPTTNPTTTAASEPTNVNLNGLHSALGTPLITPTNEGNSSRNASMAGVPRILGVPSSHNQHYYLQQQRSILTIFFQGKNNLAAPSTTVPTRLSVLNAPLPFDAPRLPTRPGEQAPAVPSADVLRLAHGPDQDNCPYELRARNIEPRIHITATANNSICTFTTNLHDTMLFEQNGAAVGPRYGRAFGVLTSLHIKGLTPTAICMTEICALVTPDGAVMSAPSSPKVGGSGGGGGGGGGPAAHHHGGGTAYSPYSFANPNTSTTAPSQVVAQHYSSAEDGAVRFKVLADALQSTHDDFTNGMAQLPQQQPQSAASSSGGKDAPPLSSSKMAQNAHAKAQLSWQAIKAKDDAIIRASKYTATIAFEPILFVGVHTGSIDVISLPTQKELFRFNTGDVKGSKLIDGFACSAITCVHSMSQACVAAVLRSTHALEQKVWSSGGCGSTRNFTPSSLNNNNGGGGGVHHYPTASSGGGPLSSGGARSLREEAMGSSSATPSLGGGGGGGGGGATSTGLDTPIRSVYAAGFDNGEVLLIALSKSSGEVLQRVSYGRRPITTIRVGCLPWELHLPPPYCKQNGRNYHRPNDVNGAGGGSSGSDYMQQVWQQRDEFLFNLTFPSDVPRMLGPYSNTSGQILPQADRANNSSFSPAGTVGGLPLAGLGIGGDLPLGDGDVSLTPPRSMSDTSSITGDDVTPNGAGAGAGEAGFSSRAGAGAGAGEAGFSSRAGAGAGAGAGARYPEDRRNEPLNTAMGASPLPKGPTHPLSSGDARRGGGAPATGAHNSKTPFGSYAVPDTYLPVEARLTTGAFLRRAAFWNNFAMVTTSGGVLFVVSTNLSDADGSSSSSSASSSHKALEVRTVAELSMQKYKSFGSIVSSKLLFSVSPGTLAHAECVRRDPSGAAHRQQLCFIAVTTQSNNLLILRLSFTLTADLRPSCSAHTMVGAVDVTLAAKREGHASYITSIAMSPLSNKAFGFAGVACGGAGGAGGDDSDAVGEFGTIRRLVAGCSSNDGRGPTPPPLTRSRGDSLFHRSSMAMGGALSRSGAFGDGGGCGCPDEGHYYFEPLMPFLMTVLGMDQKLAFWVCEVALEPPSCLTGGGAPAEGTLARTRSDRYGGGGGGGMSSRNFAQNRKGNSSFGLANVSPPPSTISPANNNDNSSRVGGARGISPTGASSAPRLPIMFNICQEVTAFMQNGSNAREEFEPWASITSCGIDGHHTLMCLGLRGKAKFFDFEIDENSGRQTNTASQLYTTSAHNNPGGRNNGSFRGGPRPSF